MIKAVFQRREGAQPASAKEKAPQRLMVWHADLDRGRDFAARESSVECEDVLW